MNNKFFHHNDLYENAFENRRLHRSLIDYISTNGEIRSSRILYVRALTSTGIGTDHKLIMKKISMIKLKSYKMIQQSACTTRK